MLLIKGVFNHYNSLCFSEKPSYTPNILDVSYNVHIMDFNISDPCEGINQI